MQLKIENRGNTTTQYHENPEEAREPLIILIYIKLCIIIVILGANTQSFVSIWVPYSFEDVAVEKICVLIALQMTFHKIIRKTLEIPWNF